MPYTPQTWTNLPAQTTPLSAARLAHMETQYAESVAYVDAQIEALRNSLGGSSEPLDTDWFSIPLLDRVNFELSDVTKPARAMRKAGWIYVKADLRVNTGGLVDTSTFIDILELVPQIRGEQGVRFRAVNDTANLNRFVASAYSSEVSASHYGPSASVNGSSLHIDLHYPAGPRRKTNFMIAIEGYEEGVDYIRNIRKTGSWLSSLAIHGGSIEPGSAELAEKFADLNDCSLYAFQRAPGGDLPHLTSTLFDDSKAFDVVGTSDMCVSFHGAADVTPGGEHIFVGGTDAVTKAALVSAFNSAGFPASDAAVSNPSLAGFSQKNIASRGAYQLSIQLEITRSLRDTLVIGGTVTSRGMSLLNVIQGVLAGWTPSTPVFSA